MLRSTTLICLCLTAFSTACGDKEPIDTNDTDQGPIDQDQDGYSVDVDCDDENVMINPGVPEICDGIRAAPLSFVVSMRP